MKIDKTLLTLDDMKQPSKISSTKQNSKSILAHMKSSESRR